MDAESLTNGLLASEEIRAGATLNGGKEMKDDRDFWITGDMERYYKEPNCVWRETGNRVSERKFPWFWIVVTAINAFWAGYMICRCIHS